MSKVRMSFNELENLKKEFNGLFPDREKVDVEQIAGLPITIEDYKEVNSGEDHYYAVAFKEHPESFVLSGTALTKILDKDFDMHDLVIQFGEKVRTSKGQTYRPVTVIGYAEK